MSEKRFDILDIVRGITLLGFLSMFLLDGKYYLLFSLLFGIGFSLIVSKVDGGHIIIRRLLVLLCFGFAHALLLWGDDILAYQPYYS